MGGWGPPPQAGRVRTHEGRRRTYAALLAVGGHGHAACVKVLDLVAVPVHPSCHLRVSRGDKLLRRVAAIMWRGKGGGGRGGVELNFLLVDTLCFENKRRANEEWVG